jgi:hypothetical protein
MSAYTIVDQTDYLEIDYYLDVTKTGSKNGFLRIDDRTLIPITLQTRVENVITEVIPELPWPTPLIIIPALVITIGLLSVWKFRDMFHGFFVKQSVCSFRTEQGYSDLAFERLCEAKPS